MKRERIILTYKLFESALELTKEQVKWLDECTKGTWNLNPGTGLVDVAGAFDCSNQGIVDFKGVRFGKVTIGFICRNNWLISLEGAPKEVGWSFYCDNNQLTSLEGAPKEVGGSFYCDNNQLTSLEGAPKKVGGDFGCSNNRLTGLEGAPKEVGGDFNCDNNQLTSLEGAPKEVGESFYCRNNQLTSLEGSPKEVGWIFDCSNNKLTSLEGAPEKVGGGLRCSVNPVSEKVLKGIYKIMKGGKDYSQALSQYWDKIPEEDKMLMYMDNQELDADGIRKYELLSRSASRII